jgi:acetyl esterase
MLDLPSGAKRAFAGGVDTADGNTLDPEWQLMLKMHSLARPALQTLSPQEARVEYRHVVQTPQRQLPSLAHVEEMNVGGAAGSLRARFYRPNVSDSKSPLLLWFHGGGFTIGDLETTDPAARFLAAKSRVSVLSVQYRKAPEAPFPAPIEDAVAAWRWAQENAEDVLQADRTRMGVGGASAGGNLSAVVCQNMLDTGGPVPKFLLMLYSLTQHGISTPSRQSLGEGYGLDTPLINWFMDTYLGPLTADQRASCKNNPLVSPLVYERLGDMPPMIVATAGFDPLRDESKLYADAVNSAGGRATYRCFGSQIHGFAQYASAIPSAAAAMEVLAADLATHLA